MMNKINHMQQKLEARQHLYSERDFELAKLEGMRAVEEVFKEQKRQVLIESNEQGRVARRDRIMKAYLDAIENKKKHMQEKLQMRQMAIIAREQAFAQS